VRSESDMRRIQVTLETFFAKANVKGVECKSERMKTS
jgi:hypothetical protein